MAGKMTAEQVAAKMRRHLNAAVQAVETALYQGGSIIMTEAKKRSPVDLGTMKSSGYVTLPTRQGGDVVVEAGFGGAAKAYAVIQHENLSYSHIDEKTGKQVGEAKYLENAINAKEQEVRDRIKRIADRALESGYARRPSKDPAHVTNPDDGEDFRGRR